MDGAPTNPNFLSKKANIAKCSKIIWFYKMFLLYMISLASVLFSIPDNLLTVFCLPVPSLVCLMLLVPHCSYQNLFNF